ncbi:MAG TPA: YlbF family regulator [Gemmatimonadaceae bacterium]|nr:YlbF family regulator [Gemmatimonadaceae bacterium]
MLEERAKELGRLIGQSPEYQTVKTTSEALNNDREAVAKLRRMEELRRDAQRMIERGEAPTQEMETELDSLLSAVQANLTYQRAVSAQENFDKTMLRVNEWILDGIKRGSESRIITLG